VKAVEIFVNALTGASKMNRVELIAAASVYLACRVIGYPRLLDEICHFNGCDSKSLGKMHGIIARGLSLQIGMIKPADLLNRMAVQLHFPFQQTQLAYEFCLQISKYELFTTSPPQLVVAAVLCWIVILTEPVPSSISINVNDVCRVCFVPLTALKRLFVEIYEYLLNIVPMDLTDLVKSSYSILFPSLEKHLDINSNIRYFRAKTHEENGKSLKKRRLHDM
jgi:hypothetical protein